MSSLPPLNKDRDTGREMESARWDEGRMGGGQEPWSLRQKGPGQENPELSGHPPRLHTVLPL